MAEPSKEAMEAAERALRTAQRYSIRSRPDAEAVLRAALPIERERWEAEQAQRLQELYRKKDKDWGEIAQILQAELNELRAGEPEKRRRWRERWEQEVRERLEIEIERHKAAGKSANFPRPHWDRAETLEIARDSIFEEGDDHRPH